MTLKEYIEKIHEIREVEFMSRMDLARELNIAYNTLTRLQKNSDTCSFKTMKKIKAFVDKWESKNLSNAS